MRKFLFAAAAAAAITAAVPASAQVYFGADPGGAGVQVGPFGFGVGHGTVGAITGVAPMRMTARWCRSAS
jgi:hypothetical protein